MTSIRLPPRTLAPLVVLLALVGTTGTADARPRDPWASLQRPLRLKPLPPGARCPVSPFRPLDGGRLSGVGTGPVYPMPSPFRPYDRHPQWLESKTIWAWPTNLRTKTLRVLVRGIRLDGRGEMRFQLGPQWDTAPLTARLRLDTSETVGSFGHSRWGTTVTLLLVRAPGCYGLQLDWASGTSTVVVAAT
jgi:hypothetical protein